MSLDDELGFEGDSEEIEEIRNLLGSLLVSMNGLPGIYRSFISPLGAVNPEKRFLDYYLPERIGEDDRVNRELLETLYKNIIYIKDVILSSVARNDIDLSELNDSLKVQNAVLDFCNQLYSRTGGKKRGSNYDLQRELITNNCSAILEKTISFFERQERNSNN